MELDPNVTYKRAFRALAEKLGRVPGPGDSEWLRIGNEYSRSWAPAIDAIVNNAREADIRQAEAHVLGTLDEYARRIGRAAASEVHEALSRPTINPPREGAEILASGCRFAFSAGSAGNSAGNPGRAGTERRRAGDMRVLW